MMSVDIKLSRDHKYPWGFRLSGGVDYTFPLTVVRVALGSIADKAGLQAGDVVIRVNGEPVGQLTHAEVHDKLVKAGDQFELSLVRQIPQRAAKQE